MSSSPQDLQIHVRFRGNVFGPFTPDELRDLIRHGRSASTWQISLDKQTWRPITELEALVRSACLPLQLDTDDLPGSIDDVSAPVGVPLSVTGQPSSGHETQAGTISTGGTAEALWYYADGEQRVGPVPESRIIALIREGVLKPSTLVWTVNMETWRPVSETRLRRALPEVVTVNRQPGPSFARETAAPPLLPIRRMSMSLNRDRLEFGLIALASVAGVSMVLKLLLLPVSGGGLHLLVELTECGVLASLILVALAGRAWLKEAFATETDLNDLTPPDLQHQTQVPPDVPP